MIILFNDSPMPVTSGTVASRSIGVYRIATVLRNQGFEVEVIDFLSHWTIAEIESYIDSFEHIDWFGISGKFDTASIKNNEGVFTYFTLDEEKLFFEMLKKRGKVVIGGPNVNHNRFLSIKLGYSHYLVAGYADEGIIHINRHIHDPEYSLKYTDNHNGTLYIDCDQLYADVDLENIDSEFVDSDFIFPEERFPLEISRGCMFHCAFCNFTHIGKKPGTYFRGKESIKREIIDRYEKYGSTIFYFLDDTFNDSTDKMQMIKEIREETGIPFEFWAFCRLDVLKAHPEQLEMSKEIGWRSMTFGVETFNRKTGSAIGKGADPEELKKFLLHLKRYLPRNDFIINIIVGLVHDSEETIRDTVRWFATNRGLGSQVNLLALTIYNNSDRFKVTSKMSRNPEVYGYKTRDINPESPVVDWTNTNTGMTRLEAYRIIGEYSKYLRAGRSNNWPEMSFKALGKIIPNEYIEKKFKSRKIESRAYRKVLSADRVGQHKRQRMYDTYTNN